MKANAHNVSILNEVLQPSNNFLRVDKIESWESAVESALTTCNSTLSHFDERLNDIEQGAFATPMDICGLESMNIEVNKDNPLILVTTLLSSLKIPIGPVDIEKAFIRRTGGDK